MTTPSRSPNGTDVAELTARFIRRVMDNLDQVETLIAG
jgi:hypothetical protein